MKGAMSRRPNSMGGADPKHALDRGSLGGSLRLGDIGNDACAPFIKQLALFGKFKRPGGARDQAHAKARFESAESSSRKCNI
jgi:hypothetical protein